MRLRGWLVACLPAVLAGCGGGGSAAGPGALAPGTDPTPLGKCKVAASASSPLVTEWPASEKAHLEGLAASQAVAVAYSGCELRIVDACKPSGRYVWRRTTLATDTLEITSSDDLWAKLPLGAAALEGELGRSGRLAVRTTVAGQLALEGLDSAAMGGGPCTDATHVISGIAVGAFSLLSGGAESVGGGVKIAGVGAGSETRREEQLMRQAGDAGACGQASDGAPHAQCGSPIQLFLQPLAARPAPGPADNPTPGLENDEQRARRLGVEIVFPAPEDDAAWSLHDPTGSRLCDLPCNRWVPPGSGFYLERNVAGASSADRVEIPARLGHAPGSRVTAEYRAERGQPLLSKLTFYGVGLPSAALGAVMLGFGLFGDACDRSDPSCDGNPFAGGFGIGLSVMYLSFAGASYWWFAYSHPASFETRADAGSLARGRTAQPALLLGPGFVRGTF
jgi:hypothetical protein